MLTSTELSAKPAGSPSASANGQPLVQLELWPELGDLCPKSTNQDHFYIWKIGSRDEYGYRYWPCKLCGYRYYPLMA
jgi:hypothetical protein